MKKIPILILLIAIIMLISIGVQAEQKFRVFLHFDDGYSGVYENAFPIMKEYGYTGTLFMPTDYIGHSRYVNLEQLREMKEWGWEIGSHTKSHADLDKVDGKTLLDELDGSRDYLVSSGLALERDIILATPKTIWNDKISRTTEASYFAARTTKVILFDTEYQPEQMEMVMLKDSLVESVEYRVRKAKEEKKWLLLIFHEVADNGNKYYFPPAKLRHVMEILKKYDAQVSTVSEAIRDF